MGYKKDAWLEDEIKILYEKYVSHGSAICAELIPRHSRWAVIKKANSLGLTIDVTQVFLNMGIKKLDAPTNYMRQGEGYIVYKPNGHKGKAYLYHRYVMESHLGRELTSNEIVHHIDGNKHNNDIANLEILTRAEHIDLHREALTKARFTKI